MSDEILVMMAEVLKELKAIRAELADMKTRAADGWQRTPEGLPICPRHGVAMSKREKHGDTWYSHKIETPNGDEYCRGYATKNGNGWHVEAINERGVALAGSNGQVKRPMGFQPVSSGNSDLNQGQVVKVRGNAGIRQAVVDSVEGDMVCVLIDGKPYNLSIDRII